MVHLSSFLGAIGKQTHEFFAQIARLSELIRSFLYWGFLAPIEGKKSLRRELFAKQLVFIGNESLFIVCLVSASVGAVLALQAAYQLRQFGALLYTGSLVSVSMTRELGPVITAIVIAGRVGASITAELGTMKVQEEIDALITMGIPAAPFLVVPRIFGLVVMLPCLTILSYAVGMIGGYLVGVVGLHINSDLYLHGNFSALVPKDMWTGLAKSFVFSLIIGVIACYEGLSVKGGADGVGRATTQSVVLSIISIIVADGIFTAIFYYVFP
ncbi:MAG: ABC transporter permease [Candidatus Omnitrophica bacterium]|nr:ABC transporter permease [Candidatus Omnitrophota bacterium]